MGNTTSLVCDVVRTIPTIVHLVGVFLSARQKKKAERAEAFRLQDEQNLPEHEREMVEEIKAKFQQDAQQYQRELEKKLKQLTENELFRLKIIAARQTEQAEEKMGNGTDLEKMTRNHVLLEHQKQKVRSVLGMDSESKLNIGVCGEAKTGKSTFINLLRGVSEDDAKGVEVAEEGIVETTISIRPYYFPKATAAQIPGLEHFVLWDIPGAGTTKHSVVDYFRDKCLYAFDGIIIMTGRTLKESDIQFASWAEAFKVPYTFVRSQCDLDLANVLAKQKIEMRRFSKPQDEHVEIFNREKAKIIKIVKENMAQEALGSEYGKLRFGSEENVQIFCVSRLFFDNGKEDWAEFEETKLLQYLLLEIAKHCGIHIFPLSAVYKQSL